MEKSDKKEEQPLIKPKEEPKAAENSQAPAPPPPAAPADGSAEKKEPKKRFKFAREYVFDPSELVYYRWLVIISLAVIYNYLFIIGRASFELLQLYNPLLWCILDYICDLLYLIDIFVRLRTGFLEQGLLLRDTKRLAISYLKSAQFKIDVISLIPFELPLMLLIGVQKTLYPPVQGRLNRLLRINRVFETRLKIETSTTRPFLFRILYLVFILIVIIHWNGCFYYLISKQIGLGTDIWVFSNPINESSLLTFQYVSCFYWSTLMLTTIGEVESPTNSAESVVMILNFLVAIVLVATLVGNIGSVISSMNLEENKFQNKVDAIKSLMKLRKVDKILEKRVIRWFDYLRKYNQTQDESEILANLPDKLSLELASHVHFEKLKNVNIFSDCEEGLLRELVIKLRLQVYSPGDYVCRKGDIGKEMYIIQKGSLQVVSDDGQKVFVTLKEGAFFGEISILNIPGSKIGNRRSANVRSVGYSDLLRLTKNDLWQALEDYPQNAEMLIEKGKAKLAKDNLLEEKACGSGSSSPCHSPEDEAFAKMTPVEKIDLIEQVHERLKQKLSDLSDELKQNCEAMNQRVARVKSFYDTKIGVPV